MLRVTREIKSFTGQGWGQKAEVKLAGGPTYQEFIFTTNLTAAQIVLVELFVNGDPRIQLTGEDMVMLERYKKMWEQPGKFVLALGDFAARSIEGQMVSGLETMPTDNLILKVHIAPNAAPTGPVELSGEAIVSAPLQAQGEAEAVIERYLPRVTTLTYDASRTGKNTHDTMPQGGVIYKRAHFKGPITQMVVKQGATALGGNPVWERYADTNAFMLKRMGRAPQPGYFHFDAVETGFVRSEWLDTGKAPSTVFELHTSAPAPGIPILIETLEPRF